MPKAPSSSEAKIAVVGVDLGKNAFHVIGLDKRGSIVSPVLLLLCRR